MSTAGTRKPNLKAYVRDAMHRLDEAGIPILSASGGNRTLYYLATHSPELVERLVRAAVSASGPEKKVWEQMLSWYWTPEKGTAEWEVYWHRYNCLDTLLPAVVRLEATGRYALYEKQAERLIRLVIGEWDEDWQNPEKLRAAALVLFMNDENDPFKSASWTRHERDFSGYEKDILLVAGRIDEVERVVPEILKRLERKRVFTFADAEPLLGSASVSLVSGML